VNIRLIKERGATKLGTEAAHRRGCGKTINKRNAGWFHGADARIVQGGRTGMLASEPRHPIGGRGGRLITIETSRGKVHRGSSSINMMAYSQTHRLDCGLDCAETRDLDIAIKAKRQVADAAARAEAKGV
jgi:hypothetical protein